MAYSDDYIRLIRKRADGDEIKADIMRSLLFDFLNNIPKGLQWDVFNLFFPDLEENAVVRIAEAENMSAVIDLFEGEYEEDELNISDEQLGYISEGVNDFALELSDDILMNVMKAAVARGLIR